MKRAESRDEHFMRLALREAEKGKGSVSPNPLVGAVAVKADKLLAKAYHKKYGGVHAEVALLEKLTKDQASGATIYVNLEPCCHVGKTAPCTSALIEAGISRAVIAHQDPNPVVNGNGIMQLSQAGIDVQVGVLEAEARKLNRAFITYMERGRPWILLKIAQTLDGRIALANGQSRWITGEASREEVHRLRAELDAVFVGALTVLDDDPELTVRHVKGRNPVRVIADSQLRIPLEARVLKQKDKSRTWILTTDGANAEKRKQLEKAGATLIVVRAGADGKVDLSAALRELARRGIASLLVEGGGTIHAAMLRANLCDELIVAQSPMLIGSEGRPSFAELGLTNLEDAPRFRPIDKKEFGEDTWLYLEKDVYRHS